MDIETVKTLEDLGCKMCFNLYDIQRGFRDQKEIHINPQIHLYHDLNLDDKTSYECNIYVEGAAIYTIGKSLTYEDALLLGIKEAIKILKYENI